MTEPKERRRPLGVRLEEVDRDALEFLAELTNQSVSELIRTLVIPEWFELQRADPARTAVWESLNTAYLARKTAEAARPTSSEPASRDPLGWLARPQNIGRRAS